MLPPFRKGAPRCVDPTSSLGTCLATSRLTRACQRTIRCDGSGRSWTRRCIACRRQFDRLYVRWGRPSIPPEKLLRALLLQQLYTIRSERQLVEQLQYNLLFQWFVGLSLDDAVWDATTFTKNRDRLLTGDIATAFLREVLAIAADAGLLSNEHFTVDGTLLDAAASQKSFRPRDDDRRGGRAATPM